MPSRPSRASTRWRGLPSGASSNSRELEMVLRIRRPQGQHRVVHFAKVIQAAEGDESLFQARRRIYRRFAR